MDTTFPEPAGRGKRFSARTGVRCGRHAEAMADECTLIECPQIPDCQLDKLTSSSWNFHPATVKGPGAQFGAQVRTFLGSGCVLDALCSGKLLQELDDVVPLGYGIVCGKERISRCQRLVRQRAQGRQAGFGEFLASPSPKRVKVDAQRSILWIEVCDAQVVSARDDYARSGVGQQPSPASAHCSARVQSARTSSSALSRSSLRLGGAADLAESAAVRPYTAGASVRNPWSSATYCLTSTARTSAGFTCSLRSSTMRRRSSGTACTRGITMGWRRTSPGVFAPCVGSRAYE